VPLEGDQPAYREQMFKWHQADPSSRRGPFDVEFQFEAKAIPVEQWLIGI